MMGRDIFSVHDWQRPELVSRGLVGRKTFSAQDFPWKLYVKGSYLRVGVVGRVGKTWRGICGIIWRSDNSFDVSMNYYE